MARMQFPEHLENLNLLEYSDRAPGIKLYINDIRFIIAVASDLFCSEKVEFSQIALQCIAHDISRTFVCRRI
jgi:hypothetical protein